MKQIGNWVFGSFFRTIGRLLVFVVIGFIIARFVDFADIIDNFRLTDLFFEKVDAASNVGSIWVENWSDGDTWSNNSQLGYIYAQRNLSSFTSYLKTITISNNSFYAENHGDIFISGYVDGLFLANQELECTTVEDDGQGSNVCTRWTAEDIELSFQLWIDNYTDQCKIDWNIPPLSEQSLDHTIYFKATCQTHRTNFNKINYQIYAEDSTGSAVTYKLGFSKYIKYEIPNNQATVDAIEDQTQQQQQQHDETMQQQQQQHDEIMDTNMTDTNETANSFFSNFSSSDSGGLSSIVTAPLTMINKMLDGQCTSPSATWKGATITLPCGSMFWGRNGANQLQDLLNVFYGGFICYYAIRKLFMMIEGFKDPTNDRVEVSDL